MIVRDMKTFIGVNHSASCIQLQEYGHFKDKAE